MEESSFFYERCSISPLIVSRIVPEDGVYCSLAFRVIIALATDYKQKISDHRYPMLVSVDILVLFDIFIITKESYLVKFTSYFLKWFLKAR